MQPSNFDELSKALASSPSRRHALKVIVTASLGGLFGLTGIRTVFGAGKKPPCHRNGIGCDRNSDCCSQFCLNHEKCACPPAPTCNTYCPCPSGKTCVSGSCCLTANVCGSTCLAAPCDASQCLHCDSGSGTCVGCPAGQTCQSGTCCIPAFTGPCTSDDQCCDFPNSTCCNGNCCHGPAICFNGACIDMG